MKKRILLTIALILVILSALLVGVSAHSGRTDGNGGHYNHSTGEYHFHHGYPEHQHPNGECPYTISKEPNDDNDKNSSGIVVFNSEEELERAKRLVQAFTESTEQRREREEKYQEDAKFEEEFLKIYNEKKLEQADNQKESVVEQTDNDLISKIEDFILSADWEEILFTFGITFILTLSVTLLVSPYAYGSSSPKSQCSSKVIIAVHVIIVIGVPLILTILTL